MTKQEAYQEMLKGFRVKHQYYSSEEFVFINDNGEFETEDGYSHGGVNDEFWSVYQKWEDGWEYYDKPLFHENDPYVFQLKNYYQDLDEINNLMYGFPTKSQLKDSERTKSVQPKSQLNRNDLCSCGSGMKYKNCCLNKNN